MRAGEIIALLVAGLAALASLVNAFVSSLNAWRDARGLKITIAPDRWQEEQGEARYGCNFTMHVWNYARSPNMIADMACFLDSKKHPCLFSPADLLREPIAGFSSRKWSLTLEGHGLPENFDKVQFKLVPVRGRRRTFRFKKSEVLPSF